MGAYPAGSPLPLYLTPPFLRGDFDGDGVVSPLTDTLALLEFAFLGGVAPACVDAVDADDDGVLSPLLDSLAILQWGFGGGLEPPAPGPYQCGQDSTIDPLECEVAPACP